jgi:glycosyltransferase involved in cell wall biosynthesis
MLTKLPKSANKHAIFNGVPDQSPPSETDRRAARAKFGWTDDQFVVGSLGRLSDEKGVREYVTAAGLDHDSNTVWAVGGAGPLEAVLKPTAPRSIHWLGYVKSSEFLAGIDIFIQPSRTEGLSLALLEAARAKKPIVATSVGATAQAVRDGVEAILLPPLDPKRLQESVERVRKDAKLRESIASSARERFDRRFRIEAMERSYRALYERRDPSNGD